MSSSRITPDSARSTAVTASNDDGTSTERTPQIAKMSPPTPSIRAVTEPRLFVNGHASPQPFLAPLAETDWHPAQRLAPYRPRRRRRGAGLQACLFANDGDQAVG